MIPLQPHPEGLGCTATQPICCTAALIRCLDRFDLGSCISVVHKHRLISYVNSAFDVSDASTFDVNDASTS
jgi:hypothetical protein